MFPIVLIGHIPIPPHCEKQVVLLFWKFVFDLRATFSILYPMIQMAHQEAALLALKQLLFQKQRAFVPPRCKLKLFASKLL